MAVPNDVGAAATDDEGDRTPRVVTVVASVPVRADARARMRARALLVCTPGRPLGTRCLFHKGQLARAHAAGLRATTRSKSAAVHPIPAHTGETTCMLGASTVTKVPRQPPAHTRRKENAARREVARQPLVALQLRGGGKALQRRDLLSPPPMRRSSQALETGSVTWQLGPTPIAST